VTTADPLERAIEREMAGTRRPSSDQLLERLGRADLGDSSSRRTDDSERAPTAERLLVNKRELARVLKCSLPTVDNIIDRYPGFPIERRGSHGVEWEFDVDLVTAFLKRQRDAEAQQTVARDELLQQFTLPIDDTAPEGSTVLSPAQRKAQAEALRIERKLAMESGLLVPTSEIRQQLADPIAQLGRFLDTLPVQLGRRFNLPEEVVRAARDLIDDGRRSFVRGLGDLAKRGDDAAA
jgi:phage terminase Nu1 subunit (DNA packaging protein)